jgi:Spy/CpxP family protein refolding chaperone
MALLFALGATLASAQDAPHRHGKMGGFGLMRGLSRLDLTDSQKADVHRIMESKKATFESLRERNRADWGALQTAADTPSPNASEVGAAYLKLRAGRKAMRAEHKATLEQIRSVLTSEQKEKLDTMIQQRKERSGDRRGMRGHFGR